jgi:hypothetical protein
MKKAVLDLKNYCTVAEFREFPHGVDLDGIEDPEIKSLFTICGYWLQEYIDKPILEQAYTETKPGTGGSKVLLRHPPKSVISIKEIREKDDMVDIPVADIYVNKNQYSLEYKSNYFYKEFTYEIKYRTGESTLCEKVKFALFFTMADYINARDYDGMKSVKLDTITVNFEKTRDPVPMRAKALLSEYLDGPGVV